MVPSVGFAGGLHDRDLGFVRFGWRDYDVKTGRWTAPDPIGEQGGDPDWYGYCLDDPVNGVDPVGLMGKAASPVIRLGIKVTGKKAAKKRPDNKFLQGLNRFLNGKGVDADPMASDSDSDGISDYYDEDSDWNQKEKAK